MNQFDLLGDVDNDDPSQLAAAAEKAKAAAAAAAGAKPAAGAGAGAKPAAKLPTKPAPPAQAGELRFALDGVLFLPRSLSVCVVVTRVRDCRVAGSISRWLLVVWYPRIRVECCEFFSLLDLI